MRQRNDSDAPLLVHTDPPCVVEPGGEVDHPDLVVGLTAVDEVPGTADEPVGDDATPARSSRRRAAAETTDDTAPEATR